MEGPSPPSQPRNAVKVQELKRIIEEQQRQLDAQQKQLEAQKNMLLDLGQQVQGLAESAAPPQATQQATEPSQTQEAAQHTPTSAEEEKLEWEESMFEKLLRDPRNRPEGMKLPDGWIHLPGRETDVRFGGFVQVNFIHDFQNAGFPYGEFISSQISVPTDDKLYLFDQRFDLVNCIGTSRLFCKQFQKVVAFCSKLTAETFDINQRRPQVMRGSVYNILQFPVFVFQGSDKFLTLFFSLLPGLFSGAFALFLGLLPGFLSGAFELLLGSIPGLFEFLLEPYPRLFAGSGLRQCRRADAGHNQS